MAAYVEMDQVTKTYQMGEVTIRSAIGVSAELCVITITVIPFL